MSKDVNRQLAAFLIQKNWVPADKVVYLLEVANAGEESLIKVLAQKGVINQKQAQKLQEWLRNQKSRASKNRIPGYKITGKLGTGGMGSVYRAQNLKNSREVAIKVLSKQFSEDEEYIRRFLREARSMRQLNHPHIVRAYDCGYADGLFYLVMEFVDGISGYDWLEEENHTEEELAKIGLHMAKAMAHYNELGMVHRDIKPDNILINQEGNAKLCDLGLAKRENFDTRITATGVTLGTPHYLSPEQARGDNLDIRADIYSLGATLFHMATGSEPYVAKNVIVIMQKHLYDPLPSLCKQNPSYSPEFERIIHRMMAKKKEERYQTPEELEADFAALREGTMELGNSSQPDSSTFPTIKAPIVQQKKPKKDQTESIKLDRTQRKKRKKGIPLEVTITVIAIVMMVLLIVLFLFLQR